MSVMEEEETPRPTRRSFSKEFKADAVALVLDEDRTIADVARSLGVSESNRVTGSARPESIVAFAKA